MRFGLFRIARAVPARPTADDGAAHELRDASDSDRKKIDSSAQLLGYMLGDALYEAYLKGRVSRSMLRRLFLVHLDEPGLAKEMFREIAAQSALQCQEAAGFGYAVVALPSLHHRGRRGSQRCF